MRRWIYIFIALLLPLSLVAEPVEAPGSFDMDEYLYGHVRDSYEWHITTVKGHPVSIPLPVIVASKTGNGFHIFSSKHLEEGEYEGFYIAPAGSRYENKIVERAADGSEVRPWDFSITKNVAGLLINCALLLFIVLGTARWYRKHDAREEAPKGGVGVMEMLVTMIENDVIKSCVGEDYKKYSPYLLTAFFFIFINNLMGIVPLFPGGANITGNIAVTLVLALFNEDCVRIDEPVYKECGKALIALMAYACSQDKDQDFEKWVDNYRNKSNFSPSQKVNFTYMKQSFDNYTQASA